MDLRKIPSLKTLTILFLFWFTQGTWKGILVFDILLIGVLVVRYWYKEERWNGRNLLCSLPISRKEYITGRFFSTWVQICYLQLIVIAVSLLIMLIYPDRTYKMMGLFHIRSLMILLSCCSIFLLFLYPIYCRFDGRVTRKIFTYGFIFLIWVSSLWAMKFTQTDPELRMTSIIGQPLLKWVDLMVFLKLDYPTITNYLITIVLIFGVNYGTLKISEILFLKNNVPQ